MRNLIFVFLLLPLSARAIPEEEKQRGCRELSNKVLAVQRKMAFERCMEFVTNECERVERLFKESCRERSHLDNAIGYDMERGSVRSCQAGLMKRESHRSLCEGLRGDCRTLKVALGGNKVEASCVTYRDEDDKKICAEVEKQADRIIAAEKTEKEKCEMLAKPKTPGAVSTHGTNP